MERRQLFRLCHSCGHLNESEEEILRCAKCAKSFLPLNYFEKIRQKLGAAKPEGQPSPFETNPGEPANAIFSPINGLIVFW